MKLFEGFAYFEKKSLKQHKELLVWFFVIFTWAPIVFVETMLVISKWPGTSGSNTCTYVIWIKSILFLQQKVITK